MAEHARQELADLFALLHGTATTSSAAKLLAAEAARRITIALADLKSTRCTWTGTATAGIDRADRSESASGHGDSGQDVGGHGVGAHRVGGQGVGGEGEGGRVVHGHPGYRPPAGLRRQIQARDRTCRFPTCNRPAHTADLDHTIPYHRHGPTCACNLAVLCRRHHRLKQDPAWELIQPWPGLLLWISPTGHWYLTTPHEP